MAKVYTAVDMSNSQSGFEQVKEVSKMQGFVIKRKEDRLFLVGPQRSKATGKFTGRNVWSEYPSDARVYSSERSAQRAINRHYFFPNDYKIVPREVTI